MKQKVKPFISSAAEAVCLLRAKSFNEKRDFYKSDDFIAVLIGQSLKSSLSLKHHAFTLAFNDLLPMLPSGIYEYIVARTRYIDNLFETVMNDVSRVFILGAGFDSRAWRFQQQLQNCLVYECDHPDMQMKKRHMLQKIDIGIPANFSFIPIDFSNDSFADFIKTLAIVKNEKCVFILEGLLMYLTPPQADQLMQTIKQSGSEHCVIFFDYAYYEVIQDKAADHSAAKCYEYLKVLGETWRFGIERGAIRNYLQHYQLGLCEELTARDMQKIFFTDDNGQCHGKVMDATAWVLAERS